MNKIGFIGTGIMGKSMLRNLKKEGYEIHIYARNKAKVEDIIAEGVIFHNSIKECVKDKDAVITIVGFPSDVEQVYFGSEGILENANPGTYVIDMTTSSPKLAKQIYEKAKEKGIKSLDAPVTGGDTGAKQATLSILVGGDRPDFEKCYPLFQAMGDNINYQGSAGFGQHTKMVNQIIIAGTISGVCEGLAYAKAKELDLDTVLKSIGSGAAGSKQLETMAPRILRDDFNPGFFIKHFIKDMNLANEEAKISGLELSVLELVLSHYQELEGKNKGDWGTQGLFQYYQDCQKN